MASMVPSPANPSTPRPGQRSDADAGAWSSQDVVALQALQPLGGRYLPWSPGAMQPSGLLEVLNEIVLGPRERILECGSGISTVLIARLLAQRGGNLVSLEHDQRWASFVERELEAEGLGGHARVLLAPLEPHPLELGGNGWYPAEVTEAAVQSLGAIDLLIVDGPPADRPEIELSRYPALPVFAGALAPGAAVVLDDASRPGETQVLERWEAELGLEQERRGDLAWITPERE